MFFLFPDKKTFTDDLVERLEDRARETGESEKQFSKRIGMSEGLFKNLRSGSMPSADRLDTILKELGLQLTLGANSNMELIAVEPPKMPAVMAPLEGLGDRSKQEFVRVPVHDALLAAGVGVLNENDQIVDYLAFNREWLHRRRLLPGALRVAKAFGDSMEPAIRDGDMLLLDCSKAEPPLRPRQPGDKRPAKIYAFLDEHEARVKRMERLNDEVVLLLSDNPSHPPETKSIRLLSVIGEVVWWARTNKE